MISHTVRSLVLVLCIATSSAQLLQFQWKQNPITIIENGPAGFSKFGFHGFVWPYTTVQYVCMFKTRTELSILPAPNGNGFHVFPLSSVNRIKMFTFRALNDNICKDWRLQISVKCGIIVDQKFKELKVQKPILSILIKNTDPASLCDDPHFTQRVNGVDENGKSVTKKVCYDLYGKSGDQLELISDNLLRTSIVFQLRDDYYIGKAFYSTKLGMFNFTTTKISLPSLQMKTWGLRDNFVIGSEKIYPHAVVKQSENDVLVDYIEEHRSESIRFVKVDQSYGKSYLNVLVEKSATKNGVFDENHGGIFGVIANQMYEFYEPVQEKDDRIVVKINGRFVKGFLKGSGDETDRCYSMSLEDLIFPMNVDSFQKSL